MILTNLLQKALSTNENTSLMVTDPKVIPGVGEKVLTEFQKKQMEENHQKALEILGDERSWKNTCSSRFASTDASCKPDCNPKYGNSQLLFKIMNRTGSFVAAEYDLLFSANRGPRNWTSLTNFFFVIIQ